MLPSATGALSEQLQQDFVHRFWHASTNTFLCDQTNRWNLAWATTSMLFLESSEMEEGRGLFFSKFGIRKLVLATTVDLKPHCYSVRPLRSYHHLAWLWIAMWSRFSGGVLGAAGLQLTNAHAWCWVSISEDDCAHAAIIRRIKLEQELIFLGWIPDWGSWFTVAASATICLISLSRKTCLSVAEMPRMGALDLPRAAGCVNLEESRSALFLLHTHTASCSMTHKVWKPQPA